MPLPAAPNHARDPSGLSRDFKLDAGLKLHPDAGRWSEVDVVQISARQTPGDLGPHHAGIEIELLPGTVRRPCCRPG